MAPRFSLEHELRMSVELAAQRLKVASSEFEACKDMPQWLRARQEAEHEAALEALRVSVDRLNAFIFEGKLPAGLSVGK